MADIVMITRDRRELTEQCIRSMRENAADWSRHRLVVVFDGTGLEMAALQSKIKPPVRYYPTTWLFTGEQLGVGGAKNFGARHFERQCEIFGKLTHGELELKPTENALLMFSDNDLFYLPHWDKALEAGIGLRELDTPPATQLGGWRHPYHRLGREVAPVLGMKWDEGAIVHQVGSVREVDAVTGNCFVIRWADWLKYGPFDSNAIGPGQSEDYALSQRIRAGGGLVATLDPPVAIHCGLVNSVGEPATGWRECEEQITEQLAGLSAEMRESVLIMRPAPTAEPKTSWNSKLYSTFGKLRVGPDTKLPDGRTVAETGLQPGPIVASQYMPGKSLLQGTFEEARKRLNMQPRELAPGPEPQRLRRLHAVNIGSGQRRFESVPAVYWQNVDLVSRPPDQVPDIVGDARNLDTLFVPNSLDYVVSHHLHEHLGHGEADPITRAAYNVLRAGGSLLVFTPDARKLAGRWLGGELDDFQFAVQMMGAYQGEESDRHKWIYTQQTLEQSLADAAPWREVKPFDWRAIPGADLARDFYIAAVECVK